MQSKYGFSDGNATPVAIELYRTVYIRTMNKLLEKHGSGFRLAAFDRGGMHNWCMFFVVPLEEFNTIKDPETYIDHEFSATDPVVDDAYVEALEEAHEMQLDDFVIIDAKLDSKSLEKHLKSINP
jgi:hypothetical protein